MSIDDERELRERLDGVLEAITPSPAPVAATLRRGRTIRTRRRIGVAAGLAAAVGIALAAPGLVHRLAHPEPIAPAKPIVTAYPPGPDSPRGLIGWGTINGKRWDITVTSNSAPQGQCLQIDHGTQSCSAQPMTARQDPSETVAFQSSDENGVTYQAGVVQPDVARVVIALADGTKLTLHPIRLYGQRWVAFAVPSNLAIANASAYSGQSELAYAIPYANSEFVTWLRPGEQGLPRATAVIGSGMLNGAPWSDVLHVGPWGYCADITESAGPSRWCEWAPAPTAASNSLSGSVGSVPNGAIIEGYASPSVAYVVATLSDGRTIRARAVDVGGQKFWAWAVPRGQRVRRVVFYSASGGQVAAQSGAEYG